MKRLIALILITLAVGIFFTPLFLHNKLPIPSDSLVGLYHPFRDFYAKEYPRGMPFKNFLITDPVRQQYVWRYLGISMQKKAILPLWNPYNGIGMPLMANQQSALLYPLNILFFVLPFPIAWSMQIFLTPLLGGFFFYLYGRKLKLSFFGSVFGSITFAFSGFMIVWLEWNTVAQSFLWLPFILWGIEALFLCNENKKKLLYTLLISLGLMSSFFAGHLQTFFYVGLISLVYCLAKITMQSHGKKISVLMVTLCVILFLVIVSIQLIPTMQLIFLSARSIDMDWTKPGWFVPYQHLLQFVIPDFFGNPTTLNYWGVWNYAELVGYIGIIPLLFSIVGGLFVRRKVVYFFLGVLLLSLLFAIDNPIAHLPFLFHIPLLSTSQPTRLLSLIDFSLILLSAFGIDALKSMTKKQLLIGVGTIALIFLAVWIFLLYGNTIFSTLSPEHLTTAKRNSILPTSLFLLTSLVLILQAFFKHKKLFIVLCLLLVLTTYDGIHFAAKFTPFTSGNILYPTTKAITFLQQHSGEYRYMTTDDRILPPNVSAYYQLQSLDVYDPLYIQRYGEFIAAMQREKPSITSPFGFNRIIAPHSYNNPFINLLGVKYIVALDPLTENGVQKVFEEGQTKIYENTHVLPRAFFVTDIIQARSKQDAIEKLYGAKDTLLTKAIVEGIQNRQSLPSGRVTILSYTEQKVTLQTNNSREGFLVLSDAFYPTWHSSIDGKETPIFLTDYVLRGIFVPKGNHTVVFINRLF